LWLQKKGLTTNFFSPLSFVAFLDPGSGMGKNQDPGSGINIPDPQHWFFPSIVVLKSKNVTLPVQMSHCEHLMGGKMEKDPREIK
jgi:hypothetical protein